MRVITAWFELVDEDGSGGLDGSELAAALKAAGLPCDEQSIVEMISLMDLNRDNEIRSGPGAGVAVLMLAATPGDAARAEPCDADTCMPCARVACVAAAGPSLRTFWRTSLPPARLC